MRLFEFANTGPCMAAITVLSSVGHISSFPPPMEEGMICWCGDLAVPLPSLNVFNTTSSPDYRYKLGSLTQRRSEASTAMMDFRNVERTARVR
jgi:hypothetical protein